MNLNDLKIFEAVASTGSFTKAAASMFTVQSNVTARIKNLEEECGTPLFLRTSRKVQLTAEGHILLQYCKKIGHLIIEAKHNIISTDKVIGSLKIGCIETTMALKVPKILNQFEERYPEVDLEFRSAMRSVLVDQVLLHNLDAAFVSGPVHDKGLNQVRVREEQLVILTASNGPSISKLLNKQPLRIVVFGEGCVFRARLESWLSSKGIIHYKSTILNSIEGIINFVEAGIGISLLPEEVITNYYSGRKIKSYPLSKELGTMQTLLICRKDETPSRSLKAFMDMYA